MIIKHMAKNDLIHESSPYLLQHSDNPVHWFPWGEKSLKKAATENKPILLSIGYSACHWCHVMAHESFEDPKIAKIMNQFFINIKIDREERPDIDQIYQTAHQILTQRTGGWPLTMFLDPLNHRPFFGGTYFPNEPRHGMPSFPDLLVRVADYYKKQQNDIKTQGEKLNEIFNNLLPITKIDHHKIDASPLALARKEIENSLDKKYGGIGSAPKFPHPTTLDRLLRHWRNSAFTAEPDIEALYMATLSLTRMAEGGIYDQLAGGFYRYSVDRYWQIPHFEKMLYDNGALLSLYAHAYLATGDKLFKKIAKETANWILNDMQAIDGGFYSTLNADSEGKEGTYYVWEKKEIEQLIETKDIDVFSHYFGLDQAPNFENKWHLTVQSNTDALIKKFNITKDQLAININANKKRLLQERVKRISPSLDDKQLTAWNALVIKGLAIADRVLEGEDFSASNFKAIDFIQHNHMHENRLMACYKNDQAKFPAYLDDYAYLLDALIESLQTKWHTQHLDFAIQLADQLLEYFFDNDHGGFFFTANDHEKLIYRPKPMADDATPSGNGIASFALQRLGWLLGENRYLSAAEATLHNAWEMLSKAPHGHVTLINTLEEYLEHPEIIIIRGNHDEIQKWQQATNKIYSPRRMIFAIPSTEKELPSSLGIRKSIKDKVVAYHCKGNHCSKPISSFEELLSLITETDKA
jgi:uncharacterized protein YyaL (SSP411 family)